MPVVMRNTGPAGSTERQTGSGGGLKGATVPTPVFVAVIVVVLLVVLFFAYRLFGPPPRYDNAREGAPVTRDMLAPPPPVQRRDAGGAGKPGAPQGDPAQTDVGQELPPDAR